MCSWRDEALHGSKHTKVHEGAGPQAMRSLFAVIAAAALASVRAQVDPSACSVQTALEFTFDLTAAAACAKGTVGEAKALAHRALPASLEPRVLARGAAEGGVHAQGGAHPGMQEDGG